MDETLAQKQREAVEALQGARRAGVPLSDYTKSKGLELRPVYDAIATLRRRGTLAQIITAKFVDGIPLYRQEPQFGRMGIPLGRGTMALWASWSSTSATPGAPT